MLVRPELVVFQSQGDIVDYVTGGFPPTRKNFESLMTAVRNPYDGVSVNAVTPGKDVIIPQSIIPQSIDIDVYEDILRRTYENRITNIALATAGVILITATGIVISSLLSD